MAFNVSHLKVGWRLYAPNADKNQKLGSTLSWREAKSSTASALKQSSLAGRHVLACGVTHLGV